MKQVGRFLGRLWQFIVLLVIMIGALFFALFQGNAVSWAIFYAQLPFTLYALLVYMYPLSFMTIERHVSRERLQYGDTLQVTVIARKKVPFPHFYFVMLDRWYVKGAKIPFYEAKKFVMFTLKKEITWHYTIEQMPRGEYEATVIQLEVADIVNWVQRTKSFATLNEVLVYPRTIALTEEWTMFANETSTHVTPFQAVQDVLSVASIRPYEHGDRLSWVHWKSFAKTEELMTKEFDHQEAVQGMMLFDPRTTASLEARITFTASMIMRARQERMTLRFCHLQEQSVSYTTNSFQEIEQIFTSLARTTGEKNYALSMDEVVKGRQRDEAVMIVTAFIDWTMIETLIRTGARNRLLIFLVLEQEGLTAEVRENIVRGQQKGVLIQPIIGERLMASLKEVKE